MYKSNEFNSVFEERKQGFLTAFSKETKEIRDSIVNDLPAYNMLLSLEATTFEELGLQIHACEQEKSQNALTSLLPSCPYCESIENVGTKGKGRYYCRNCGKKFSANHNSISSGTKKSTLQWMKVLLCLLNYYPIKKACKYCDMKETTYYRIRNRIFYAMELVLKDIKLYGNIQVDNTFVRISYKGKNLSETEYDENSIFFDSTFKPRSARKRGGSYNYRDINANQVCIFTAIDDYGHVLTRYCGVGATNHKTLSHYVPNDTYLLTVPKIDPAASIMKKQTSKPLTKPQDQSLMIADKEKAIDKYATEIGILFESHAFRKHGEQIKLPSNCHNIQKVNALHKRLKEFLLNHHYVSTKYLPGFLTLFEFIENTGASDEAIKKLFRILATPNLSKSPTYYKEKYSIPNYLEEWLVGDNSLNKVSFNKLYGFYLYYQIKNSEEYPDCSINMKEICEITGYTAPTIRRNYHNLLEAGYCDLILDYFNKVFKIKTTKPNLKSPANKAPKTVNPIILAIYDEYAKLCSNPNFPSPNQTDFFKEKNKQYGTDYSRTNLLMKFKYIVDNGIREPIQHHNPQSKRHFSEEYLKTTGLNLYKEFLNLKSSFRKTGSEVPKTYKLYRQLAEQHSLTENSVADIISKTRQYLKECPEFKKKHFNI